VDVRVEHQNSVPVCVAHLEGDLDMAVVPEIRNAVDSAICSGCTNVVLDFSDVHYADSSALGLLVWLDHRLEPYGGRLVLAHADRNVSRILELSGLIGIAPSIATADNVADALENLDLAPADSDPVWVEEFDAPAGIEEMGYLRGRVCSLVETLGMPEAGLFDLKVAVGEALANAVRHGSPAGAEDLVHVTVSAYPDRAVVDVRDRGRGFDGQPVVADDVYASGGRGVLFMKALMDRVDFEQSADGGTVVRLTKRLPARPSGNGSGGGERS
jgi:serine/threonine-protein kinase RsbW